MNIKVILFDLDGTLLPMDQEVFVKSYFGLLAKKLAPHGYEAQKLIESIWTGTAAMVKNDGTQSNEAAFWKKFAEIYGEKVKDDIPLFDDYYKNEFSAVKESCGFNEEASKTVAALKEKGFTIALATNPIFPGVATENRIRWAGLSPEDFALYTTYETCRFCKPNLNYYTDIVKQLGVKPEECLMVGNDVTEDMVARELGMQVFLLTDCLINKEGKDISAYPNGSFKELMKYIEVLKKGC